MNAVVTISAVELALLRAEASKRELDMTFERLRGREITDDDDARLSAASDAWERDEANLKQAITDATGVDAIRLVEALS